MVVTVDGLTKVRMLEIEAASVTGGNVNGAGHLILTRHDGAPIDAGSVIGPQGPPFVNGVDTVSTQSIGGNKFFTQKVTFNPLSGTSIEITREASFMQIASIRVGRTNASVPQSIGFYGGTSFDFMLGRSAGTDDLVFGTSPIAGSFTEKLRIVTDGSLKSIGSSSLFGGGAYGADMSATQIGQYDADYAVVNAFNAIRANVGMIIQSKGSASVLLRVGANTGYNLTVGNDGVTYPNRSDAGTSLQINRETSSMAVGSLRIGRTTAASHHSSIVFFGGVGYDFIVGRSAGVDDLQFGINFGAGFTEVGRMKTDGTLQWGIFRVTTPAGGSGKVLLQAPSNYGRIEVTGNSNGIIGADNTGTVQYLFGMRADVTGNNVDTIMYTYNGGFQIWIGGVNLINCHNTVDGKTVTIGAGPYTTWSGLELGIGGVGARRVVCGAVDSGGAGFRQLIIPN